MSTNDEKRFSKRTLVIGAASIVAAVVLLGSGIAYAGSNRVTPTIRPIIATSTIQQESIPSRLAGATSPEAVVAPLGARAASSSSAHIVTTARSGEGVIRITLRVCGSSQNWQAVAAENGIRGPFYPVMLNQTLRVDCGSTAVAPQSQPAPAPVVRSTGWTHPLPGRCATSGFGWRNGKIHNGVDLPAGYGTNVLAVAAGTAYWGNDPGGAGLYLTVNHGGGVWTTYFHLSSRVVGNGQWVNAGQHIGEVGSTGNSTGPHLHFEVHPWGQWTKRWNSSLNAYAYINPIGFMSERGVRLSC